MSIPSHKIIPSHTDVKPRDDYKNPGNKVYIDLVKKNRKAFVYAHMTKDMQTKDSIVKSIYARIAKQSPPGRFLEKSKDGSYSVKSKEDSFKKIKKALNENKRTIEDYFRLRGHLLPLDKGPTIRKMHVMQSETANDVITPQKTVLSPKNTNVLTSKKILKQKTKLESTTKPKVKKDQILPTTPLNSHECSTATTVTSSDWYRLHKMLDQEPVKPRKKQRFREIRGKKKKAENNDLKKKTSKKVTRNEVDDLCDKMKSHTLCDERKEKSKMMRLGRACHLWNN